MESIYELFGTPHRFFGVCIYMGFCYLYLVVLVVDYPQLILMNFLSF
jgi:hypothetical protein